jgi:predicted RNase H-like HicB family nuclease
MHTDPKPRFIPVFKPVLKSEGGGYVAYAEEVPGAVSECDMLEQASENLCDTVEILFEADREPTRKPLPLLYPC